MDKTTFFKRCCSFFTALLTVLLVGGASTVYAVELDGNLLNNGMTDWEDIFDVVGDGVPTEANPLPAPYGGAVFIRDFKPGASGPDISTFATGSKDTLPITPGWECTRSNNVNDKTDIINAYAAVANEGGDTVVYFALERYSNEGDGNVGFWFLQDPEVACVLPENGNPKTDSFAGNHVDGDVLIVSEFSKGGKVATVEAYEWQGGALIPLASGMDCDDAVGDLCATVNDVQLTGYGGGTDIPWLTETKTNGPGYSNNLEVSELFEGRINLSEVLETVACFSKYMGVTRSSTSLTATLFDYALGDFPLCSIDAGKSCDARAVNTAGDKIRSTFTASVENDGISSVYDVSIEEDITNILNNGSETGEFCHLTAYEIDSVPVVDGNLPVDLTDGSAYVVASTLAGSSTIDATIVCETFEAEILNEATFRAKTFAAATEPDLAEAAVVTIPDGQTFNDLCALNVQAMATIDKVCDDVTLDVDDNNILRILAAANITLTNTSNQGLVNVEVDNVAGASQGGDALPLYYADSSFDCVDGLGSNTPADPCVEYDGGPFSMAKDDVVYFRTEYYPDDVDGGALSDILNGSNLPDNADFTDRVDATGDGVFGGSISTLVDDDEDPNTPDVEVPGIWDTATCPLCP